MARCLLSPNDGTVDYIQMPLYQVLADVTVYGVDVAIVEGSDDFTPVRGSWWTRTPTMR